MEQVGGGGSGAGVGDETINSEQNYELQNRKKENEGSGYYRDRVRSFEESKTAARFGF